METGRVKRPKSRGWPLTVPADPAARLPACFTLPPAAAHDNGMARSLTLPEMTLREGARLFVAATHLHLPPLSEPHRYTFYSLGWLSGGRASLVCDTERFEVAPQSLICLTPGMVSWWEEAQPGAHLTLLGFEPDIFTGGALDVRLLTDLPLFQPDATAIVHAPGKAGQPLSTLFGQMERRYTELAASGPTHTWQILPRQQEGLLLAYLHAILAEAATLDLGTPTSALNPAHSADLRLTRLFRLYVLQEGMWRQPVMHYAARLHVTPDHLARVVRRVTGKSPSAWLQERLVLEAKRRLTLTSAPIEQIAEALEFASASQFSQWFRSRSGQTPSQIRQGTMPATLP